MTERQNYKENAQPITYQSILKKCGETEEETSLIRKSGFQFYDDEYINVPSWQNIPLVDSAILRTTFNRNKISAVFFGCNRKKFHNGTELSLKGKDVYKKLDRRIDDEDIPPIVEFLIKNKDINAVDLSYNAITDVGFMLLCAHLLNDETLHVLNLRNNELRDLDEDACKMLAQNKCLKRLVLSGNFLSDVTTEQLKCFLTENKCLEVLEISGVDYHAHSACKVIDSLQSENKTLKVLNVSRLVGRPYYRTRSYYLASQVGELLIKNETLVELHLEKNELTDSDIDSIVGGLRTNHTLKILNLTANAISSFGLESFCDVIPHSELQVLLLKGNKIGNQGAMALSRALPLSKIVHLDISNNRIGDIGMVNLLWTIKKPVPLYTFFIFGNPFSKLILEIINVQMLRGKLFADSLDLILYWDEEGCLQYSYNNEAEVFRNLLCGIYDYTFKRHSPYSLEYPCYDIFKPNQPMTDRYKRYPPECNMMITHYEKHIRVM